MKTKDNDVMPSASKAAGVIVPEEGQCTCRAIADMYNPFCVCGISRAHCKEHCKISILGSQPKYLSSICSAVR